MNLIISGLSDVAAIQEQQNITRTLGIIEFDPRQRYMNFYQGKSTWIHVDDIEAREHSDPNVVPPALIHVEKIIAFTNELIEEDNVLVHCFAGISRSTAAALIIAYIKLGDVDRAGQLVFDIRPQAAPNRLICQIADGILGTGTALFDAANRLNAINGYKDFWNNKNIDWNTGLPFQK